MKRICLLTVVALASTATGASTRMRAAVTPMELEQGWTDEDKYAFWYTPQGSMLLPYVWFLKLEQAQSRTLFRDDGNMERLRFLTTPATNGNPDGLPIGFVKARHTPGLPEMVGLTCAACHTSRIELGSKVVQVEGGAPMADFQAFVDELVAALGATAQGQRKFERFARQVAGEASGDKAASLRRDLEKTVRELEERKQRNEPPHPYGYARVDAFGNILNEVLAKGLGVPENRTPADAPVSYPVIWDAPQHDFLQWNGSATNAGPGPLLRNIGQVLGVFGHMEFTPRAGRPPVYENASVDIENQQKLEALVARLRSPLWPATFPTIDAQKARAGETLYRTHCIGCHALIRRDDPGRRIEARMVRAEVVGTDPVAAESFLKRVAKTGVLKDTPIQINPQEVFGETAPAALVLRNAALGVLLGKDPDALTWLSQPKPPGAPAARRPEQLTVPMYKARPHNGVWSSAPYLHNGSVPSLWELLQVPERRARRFYVGSRQFDPGRVGFKSVKAENGVRHFLFDTTLRGNSNAGHPFGTDLSDVEKLQVIEYLKTL